MKNIYILILFVFLASCTNQETANENMENNNTNEQIENEMENSFSWDNQNSNEDTTNNKVEKLDASYKNPKTEVDMVINYSLNENNTIESINVNATTFDVSEFNEKIQYLVWEDIEEAEDVYISGSSLTSEAFVDTIKNR